MNGSLVQILDHRSRILRSSENGLVFEPEGDVFELRVVGSLLQFRSLEESKKWISLQKDEISLGENPATLAFFTDLDNCEFPPSQWRR